MAVLVALFMMRPAELHQRPVVARAKGQVREGLRYVWSTPGLRDPLLAMAVVGIFAFNFTTTLPLLATRTFHGGAGTYGALLAAMGRRPARYRLGLQRILPAFRVFRQPAVHRLAVQAKRGGHILWMSTFPT